MKKLIIILFAVSISSIAFSQNNVTTEKAPEQKVVVKEEGAKVTQVNVNNRLQTKVPSKVIATKEQMVLKESTAKNASISKEANKTESPEVVPENKKPVQVLKPNN